MAKHRLKGALLSSELAYAIRNGRPLAEAVAEIGPTGLFRCPQCHQRVKVFEDHFEHVNEHTQCLLTLRLPD